MSINRLITEVCSFCVLQTITWGYIHSCRRRWLKKSRTHRMEEGSERSAGQQIEVGSTGTKRFKSGETEGQKDLYLAGADSSFLSRPDIHSV